MNLREVVAAMECLGKPEASENAVLVTIGNATYAVSDVELLEDSPVRHVNHIRLIAT